MINADDFYGRGAFQMIYDYLDSNEEKDMYQFAMVGYLLKNTLTENGHVARGVCQVVGQDCVKTRGFPGVYGRRG